MNFFFDSLLKNEKSIENILYCFSGISEKKRFFRKKYCQLDFCQSIIFIQFDSGERLSSKLYFLIDEKKILYSDTFY